MEGAVIRTLRPFKRNELVILRRPKMQNSLEEFPAARRVLKQIVAVEGDKVAMFDGKLYINRVKQDELFIAEDAKYTLFQNVPTGHVLVLGDNHNISYDGHNYGAVPTKCIIGHTVFRPWPFCRVGLL